MSMFVEESGRTFRVNAGFDLSGYTELTIIFCKPDGSTTVEKTTADGVVLGAVAVTDDIFGALTANYYVEYPIEVGLIESTDAGQWAAQVLYTDTGASPNDNLYGDIVYFTVNNRCDT